MCISAEARPHIIHLAEITGCAREGTWLSARTFYALILFLSTGWFLFGSRRLPTPPTPLVVEDAFASDPVVTYCKEELMPSEKVLIVDDEKLVRWSLRQKCEEWGYHVLEADNGTAALRVAHNESPDLVLLDVRLPDLNGIEILEQLKKSGDARAVIMITADPQLEDVKTALKLGAYDSSVSRWTSTNSRLP